MLCGLTVADYQLECRTLQCTTLQIDRVFNIVIDDKILVTLSNTEYRSLNTNQMRYGVSNLVNICKFTVENKENRT